MLLIAPDVFCAARPRAAPRRTRSFDILGRLRQNKTTFWDLFGGVLVQGLHGRGRVQGSGMQTLNFQLLNPVYGRKRGV